MELSACIVVYNGAEEALRAAQTVLDCTRRHPVGKVAQGVRCQLLQHCPLLQKEITAHFILLSIHIKSKKERPFRQNFRKSRCKNFLSYHAKPHLEK